MPEEVAVETTQWFWNVRFHFEQQISRRDFAGLLGRTEL